MIFNDSILDILAQIEDSSFDCIITSPPYNVGKDYEKTKSLNDYLSAFEPVLKGLKRVLKESGSVAWQVGNFIKDKEVYPLDIYFYPLFKDLGFRLRNRIIWKFGLGNLGMACTPSSDLAGVMKPYSGLARAMITLLI